MTVKISDSERGIFRLLEGIFNFEGGGVLILKIPCGASIVYVRLVNIQIQPFTINILLPVDVYNNVKKNKHELYQKHCETFE